MQGTDVCTGKAHHDIFSTCQPREDVGLLRLRHDPESAADMEVLVDRPVIVGDGVGMLCVDEEVIGEAWVAQVMHCCCTNQAEHLQFGEVKRVWAGFEDDHGSLSHVSCMRAVVVVVGALVGGLHCHKEALRFLPVDHPTGFLQFACSHKHVGCTHAQTGYIAMWVLTAAVL